MKYLQILYAAAIFIGLYILFPLWAAKKAREKGLEKVSKYTRISILFLLGWIGGLVALIAASRVKTEKQPARRKSDWEKTWVDNLAESGLMLLVGAIPAGIGYLMWRGLQGGTEGAVIYGGLPLPLEFVAILAIIIGASISLAGLGLLVYMLFRRLVRGNKRYERLTK